MGIYARKSVTVATWLESYVWTQLFARILKTALLSKYSYTKLDLKYYTLWLFQINGLSISKGLISKFAWSVWWLTTFDLLICQFMSVFTSAWYFTPKSLPHHSLYIVELQYFLTHMLKLREYLLMLKKITQPEIMMQNTTKQ